MLKIYLLSNPKLLYQKFICYLFNTKYYHIEFELEYNNKNLFLRSNYSGNEISEDYISYYKEDLKINFVELKEQHAKLIFEYFNNVNNKKYNFFNIFRWYIDIKINKIKYNKLNNIDNDKYNCYNHFININNILDNKIYHILDK